jgi:hypothetical protein
VRIDSGIKSVFFFITSK